MSNNTSTEELLQKLSPEAREHLYNTLVGLGRGESERMAEARRQAFADGMAHAATRVVHYLRQAANEYEALTALAMEVKCEYTYLRTSASRNRAKEWASKIESGEWLQDDEAEVTGAEGQDAA